jgi:hypothetical protein
VPEIKGLLMKWKINSIGYADRILTVIGVLIIILPLALYIGSLFLGLLGIKSASLLIAAGLFIATGLILLIGFIILLIIEQFQDRYLDIHYFKSKRQKLNLANGYYECPYCGSQKVSEFDKQCPVCYKELQ